MIHSILLGFFDKKIFGLVNYQVCDGAPLSEKDELPRDGKVSMVFTKGAKLIRDARKKLDIALQPIVEVQSGDVFAYEALMRGYSNLGFDSIFDLLMAAFRHRVLVDLDMLLREKTIKKFASLPHSDGVMLFYNFDGRVLEQPESLYKKTEKLLTEHSIPISALCIEFSETFNYSSALHVKSMIEEYRRGGARFAIDDFGRGFSELKVLYDYHPDFIKVDRFFITDINDDSRKRLFVSTIVNLAHVLGVKVVAEGIETAAEYRTCQEIGCNLIQGFFVSRPILDIRNAPKNYPSVKLARYTSDNSTDSNEDLIRDRLVKLPYLHENESISDVIELFRKSSDVNFFPVLDRCHNPQGILHEMDIREAFYSFYQLETTKNINFNENILSFVRKCPVADINSEAKDILDIFAYSQASDGVIITEDSRYIGFLSTFSLLEIINDKRLEKAKDQNPLTGLPGNSSIIDYISDVAVDDSQSRFLCYVDFDNFKPFNDYCGFGEGDRAIILFAELMRRRLNENEFMLGHIGGDDFFVGLQGGHLDALVETMSQIRSAFNTDVASLYKPDLRAQGFIETQDRDGQVRRFPLLSCSISILEIPSGLLVKNPDHLILEISKQKKQAKCSESGLAVMTYNHDMANRDGLDDDRHELLETELPRSIAI